MDLEQWERSLIEQALREADGNQTRAAQRLGISRDTLRYRLKKYGIHRECWVISPRLGDLTHFEPLANRADRLAPSLTIYLAMTLSHVGYDFVSWSARGLHNREASSGGRRARLGELTQPLSGPSRPATSIRRVQMKWTKPEAEVVAVTMEVTAYVATL